LRGPGDLLPSKPTADRVGQWSDGTPVTPLELQPLPSAPYISVISCPESTYYTKPLCAAVVPFTISVAMGSICASFREGDEAVGGCGVTNDEDM